jgi:type II secretory pathway pseudopilin PulG
MIQNQRKAFSMLTSIFVIVLMATVAILVMSMAGKIIKETTAQYQKEQAALLAKSYTEYAILAVMSNDRNATGNDCIENIDGFIGDNIASVDNGEGYSINTRIAYISDNDATNGSSVSTCDATRILDSSGIATPESALNIIVDVYVRYRDADNPNIVTAPNTVPWVTYHRRTLQKI